MGKQIRHARRSKKGKPFYAGRKRINMRIAKQLTLAFDPEEEQVIARDMRQFKESMNWKRMGLLKHVPEEPVGVFDLTKKGQKWLDAGFGKLFSDKK